MKNNWITAGVSVLMLVSVAACSSSSTTSSGGGGSSSSTSTTGGAGGTGSTSGTGGAGGTGSGAGTTCAAVYADGSGPWDKTLTEGDFASPAAFQAYSALNNCACVATNGMSPGGCENICTMADNGTSTPNFCDGMAALPSCKACLTGSCSNEIADCTAN